MIATRTQRRDALCLQLGEKAANTIERVRDIGGIDGRIAQIRDVAGLEGARAVGGMNAADHDRQIAQLARAVAGARPVGRPPVPGHADDADIDLLRPLILQVEQRQAHEGGNACIAGQVEAGGRLEEVGGVLGRRLDRFGHGGLRLIATLSCCHAPTRSILTNYKNKRPGK